MRRVDQAVDDFLKSGFNCSQSVLAAFGPDLGLDRENCLKIGCAFGGGIGRRGDICGAVSGGLMVIGLKYGKFKKEDAPAKEKTYQLANEFIHRFKEKHGTIICRELLDCDISTPDGHQSAQDRKLYIDVCPKFVESAVKILEELLPAQGKPA
jgi:C_GCAxxG_C_C family probable redox protein